MNKGLTGVEPAISDSETDVQSIVPQGTTVLEKTNGTGRNL